MDIERARYFDSQGLKSWRIRRGDESIAEPVTNAETQAVPIDQDWDSLEDAVRQCTLCELCHSRTQTVFGVGSKTARWMLIGEAPGADEDRQGEPFVGRAGQLLNAMLKACGFDRREVYIANILKCRPPGNRDPKPEEANTCSRYLNRQIEWVNPAVIIAVGRIAAHRLLETNIPVGKLRGRVHSFGAKKIPVVVTYHPAYLLRSPSQKSKSWQDLMLALDLTERATGV